MRPPIDQPEIREDQQDEAVQERDALVAVIDPEQRGADALGEQQADGAADEARPSMCVTAVLRSCHSKTTDSSAEADAEDDRLIGGSAPRGRSMKAEYATAPMNASRASMNQAI